MSTDFKRFTVSVSPDMEQRLDKIKQEKYYNRSQSQMVRDLIDRGLAAIQQEKADETKKPCGKND